jgi:phosphoribosylformylglycinamidine synthase subunit PurSL
MSLPVHCCIVGSRLPVDPVAQGLLADAHALGITRLERVECSALYFIEGPVCAPDLARLAADLFGDPVAQTSEWRRVESGGVASLNGNNPLPLDTIVVETALRAGVTDPVADKIVRYASVIGVEGVLRAATGQRYVLYGALTDADVRLLVQRLLANPVIQRSVIGEIEPSFPQDAHATGHVEHLAVRGMDADGLRALSGERRAALDLAEMQAIQAWFESEGREPTDVEFETIAQTWSEHCVHKTFRAEISVTGPDGARREVDGVLRTYIRAATERVAAPWVRSAFVDNAGIIDFDDAYEVSFKVETHNHPSAIEPFGGANTGVGGVIRDVLGVSARPIAATDVLCFGPVDGGEHDLPDGVLPPRRIRAGVIAGIRDYGNKIGVPTVNGAIWYDRGFTANPLVFCGCVGLAPKDRHPRQPKAGDRVLVLGGRTGRDGLRGATFSSMTMDAQTGEVAGASVQIGDPIVEKGLIEVIARARDERLYHAITDCGAGGLSSAVGEMASSLGAEVDLACVPLKYPGLAPWEIWLSEAQERMVLAAAPESVAGLEALCARYNVEMTDIGAFTGTGRLIVRYGAQVVLNLANDFLHEGRPRRRLAAKVPARPALEPFVEANGYDFGNILLRLLSHANIASKAGVVRTYDHEVQGGTVVKPYTGQHNDGPSDACVIKPLVTQSWRGLVITNGLNPEYGKLDPYRMAVSAVDEAVRNAVAVGADPRRIALLDNFCWGDPQRPATLGSLVEAARGCYEAALHYGAPFISGKDSLNNEYIGQDGQRHAIPPTLLISALGLIDDVRRAVTMDLKAPDGVVYLLGDAEPQFGGSHLALLGLPGLPHAGQGAVPDMPAYAPRLYAALHAAIGRGLVRACHDVSEGGLLVAAAEMCIGGRCGMRLELETAAPLRTLYGESNGRLLVEVAPEHQADFEAAMAGQPSRRIGRATRSSTLSVHNTGQPMMEVAVDDLLVAWQGQVDG